MSKQKITEKPGFHDFLKSVREMVRESMGGSYRVEIRHVIKNNSTELDGLIILKEKETVTPNIYLNSYYERYLGGEEISELTEEIIEIYRTTMDGGEREAACLSFGFQEMKSKIIYCLVNYRKNQRILQEIPYLSFLDLAVTFHCLVNNNEEGLGTIRITNEHLENWGVTKEIIADMAIANTPRILPPVLRTMHEVMLDMLKEEEIKAMGWEGGPEPEEAFADNFLNEIRRDMGRKKVEDLYVLTNMKGINGACCLLYPAVIKELADRLNRDLYILPSSIHEIILVTADKHQDKELLHHMVQEVNRTQVPAEEILSDHIYYYSREHNAITL